MASINVLNIVILNPLSKFKDQFQFEITFECLSPLKNEIEWKVIYIGSAESKQFDQELESVAIGPLKLGTMKFRLDVQCPDHKKIPQGDLLGVTAILLCCSYNNQEFFRVGYYINNSYDNEEMNMDPPEQVAIDRVVRTILAEKPRITKFFIDWENVKEAVPTSSENENRFMFEKGRMTVDELKNMGNNGEGGFPQNNESNTKP
ncbi:MAG: ASF1 family histone chaperone [archaeon]|nr:ASF1 family histone chaperone [archaeon]